ncbi:MAG TPA: response regulator transcription factor [Chitinophagaceae bacterium]|nr:response regulator transcription factor [Chitinophagaceae bacterium]
MISISIVEDNEQFRKALESIINSQKDMVLVDSYPDGEKAFEGIRMSTPDIVITDLSLPGMQGFELMFKLRTASVNTQFLVCTIHDDDEAVFEALKSGASGYIVKEPVKVSDIVNAIRELHIGGAPMSPYIARKVMASFQKPAIENETSLLSVREKEVLELLARGFQYKEIAGRLEVSTETIKKHLKNIYHKLQVQNKIEAVNKYHGNR